MNFRLRSRSNLANRASLGGEQLEQIAERRDEDREARGEPDEEQLEGATWSCGGADREGVRHHEGVLRKHPSPEDERDLGGRRDSRQLVSPRPKREDREHRAQGSDDVK